MTPYNTHISLKPETVLAGAVTADVLPIRGKTRLSWQPHLEGGNQRVGVWREPVGDSFSRRWGSGAIEMEYSHNLTTRRMMESLLTLAATASNTPSAGLTTYFFRPHRLEARTSFQIEVSKQTGGPHFRLKGCVMESLTINVRRTEVVKLRWGFKFVLKEDFAGAVPVFSSNPEHELFSHLHGALTVNAVAQGEAIEFTARFQNPIKPEQFSATKVPTRFTPAARFDFSGELVEYERDASTIPAFVHNQTVVPMSFALARTAAQQIKIEWPLVLFQNGTPDALHPQDNPYRAVFEGQFADPVAAGQLTMVF